MCMRVGVLAALLSIQRLANVSGKAAESQQNPRAGAPPGTAWLGGAQELGWSS